MSRLGEDFGIVDLWGGAMQQPRNMMRVPKEQHFCCLNYEHITDLSPAQPIIPLLQSHPPVINQSWVEEARLFSKSRHLRGLKRGSGSSDGQYSEFGPSMHAMSPKTAANEKAAANDQAAAGPATDQPSRSWPFAYALGLALAISALLWAIIAAIIHYS